MTKRASTTAGIGESRFDSKIAVVAHDQATGPCWEWTAARSGGGYGYYNERVDGDAPVRFRLRYAHRYAWESARGPVPEGLQLDHLCRNRACVNPDHLEPVTASVNQLRGIGPSLLSERNRIRGQQKTHCVNGHEFTPDNTFRDPSGHRGCRHCQRIAVRRYKNRRRTA